MWWWAPHTLDWTLEIGIAFKPWSKHRSHCLTTAAELNKDVFCIMNYIELWFSTVSCSRLALWWKHTYLHSTVAIRDRCYNGCVCSWRPLGWPNMPSLRSNTARCKIWDTNWNILVFQGEVSPILNDAKTMYSPLFTLWGHFGYNSVFYWHQSC